MTGAMLVGRLDERHLVATAVARLRSGRGGGIWVTGPGGIGKTALLATALGTPTGPGETTRSTPGPLGSFLASINLAARYRRDLRAVTQLIDSVPGAAADRYVEPVTRLLLSASRDRPLILRLDDVHQADDASLALWSRLHRLTGAVPLLLLSAGRPVSREAVHGARSVAASHGARAVDLAPLRETEAIALATSLGHSPHILDSAVRDSGGNPSYLEMLSGGRSEPEPALRALVSDHLSTLTGLSRHALALLAAARPGISFADLADFSDQDPRELKAGLDEARRAGVVNSSRTGATFQHPIVRRVLRLEARSGAPGLEATPVQSLAQRA